MGRKNHILILLTLALFVNCQTETTRMLNQAECLIQEKPDSALAVINGIDAEKLNRKKDLAKYALLKTMALDKNYIDEVDDSLINIAVNYYDKEHPRNMMLATYYKGIIQKNGMDYSNAVISFEKAAGLALESRDWHYLGLANRNMADCFSATNNNAAAIDYHRAAVDAFKESGESLYLQYAQYSLAVDYINNVDYDQARQTLDSLRSMLDNNSLLYRRCRLCYAQIMVETRDSTELAIEIYRTTPEAIFRKLDYGYFALAYADNGDVQSAEKCLDQGFVRAQTKEDSATLDYFKAELYYDIHRYEKAYPLIKHATLVQDSLTRVLLQQSLSMAQRDYYRQETKIQAIMLNKRRQQYALSVCVMILIAAVLFLLGKQRVQKRENALKDKILELEMIKRKDNKDKGALIGALFLEKNAGIDLSSLSIQSVKEKLRQLGKDANAFKSLEAMLNQYSNNVMVLLRKQVPEIKSGHLRTISLFFAGIPDEIVEVILGKMSVGSLKTARSRYRDQIRKAGAPNEKLFLELLEKQPRRKQKE